MLFLSKVNYLDIKMTLQLVVEIQTLLFVL